MNTTLKIIGFLLLLLALTACGTNKEIKEQQSSVSFPEKAKDMNIYEVNIRQYTPEGTLQAFIPHIQRLKNMGVDILWMMPVQPIGEKNRKPPLGSYYSIMDYTAVNPDFGSLEDFKSLVEKAHELNMVVILDWVANHTAYDHHWATKHPEYYNLDSLGNLQSPVEDWTDVADLNYDNADLHLEMMREMKWWLTETDIDGFRCDVAGMVPNEFWEMAIDSLKATKDVFMLAEWDESKMHKAGFHMTYGWEFHHLLNNIAQGKANADSLQAYIERDNQRYNSSDFRMFFTSNHDENSWNGTVFERMGEAYEALAVLASTIKGMPLIYSGQEAGLDKRLPFFDKDSIDWSDLNYEEFYSNLLKIKKQNPSLWNGTYGGKAERINTKHNTENIYAFSRKKDDNEVIVILNLSDTTQAFIVDEPFQEKDYKDLSSGSNFTFNEEELILDSWSYMILTKNTLQN
ncbi:alpha amylase C-terminal domain-containing protein [Marivirga sp. S37H4]|uniref:Alpha amylase C-terminal domain-containing protein n=1 Tax=Marivirga aurantiaca TaxID=2802615 RepID=A0A935CDU6_9BACT|nr:alpha-amylase family glycosyl hydrolase [Marivirga aurantiaca]MBK6267283.1 alpha amylase C-terminal domain-containing protein [Marivirga aurantiaca]